MMNNKKPSKLANLLHCIFVHNWDLKLGGIALGILTWVIIAMII